MTIRLDQTLVSAMEQLERTMINHAIYETEGRLSAAANRLGLSRKGLFLKRRRLGIGTGSATER